MEERGAAATRRALLAAAGAGPAAALAACAGAGAGAERAPAAAVTGTTVEYLSMAMPTAPEEAVRLQVLARFSQQNPHGITVSAVQSAGQAGAREGQISGASMAQVVAALAAGTPPARRRTWSTP